MEKLRQLMMSQPRDNYVEKTTNDVYRDVAQASGLPVEDIAAIGGVESRHGKYNKPLAGGSATGLFQFQPKTAEYLQPGSSENLEDMDVQAQLMKLYLQKNKVVGAEDAFIKHNLGKARGEKFLSANENLPISAVVPKHVIKANPGLYNVKTVGEARARIKSKLQEGMEQAELTPTIEDLLRRK